MLRFLASVGVVVIEMFCSVSFVSMQESWLPLVVGSALSLAGFAPVASRAVDSLLNGFETVT